jgi:hypothetical protein
MLRKASVLLVVCLCVAAFSGIARAQGESVVGPWDVYGKAKVSATFPGIVSLKVSLLDLSILGEVFVFEQDGSFHDTLTAGNSLGIYGTWTQIGTAVTVDLSKWVSDVQQQLQDLVGSAAVVAVETQTFGGKMGKGSWKGKFLVVFTVTPTGYPAALRVTIGGSLVGLPSAGGIVAASAPMTSPEEKAAKVARFVKDTFLFPLNFMK